MPSYEYFTTLGIAGVVLAFIGACIWRGGNFLGGFLKNDFLAIVREWVDTYKQAADDQRDAISRLEGGEQEQRNLCAQHVESIAQIRSVLNELVRAIEADHRVETELAERVEKIEKRINQIVKEPK